MWLSLSSTTPTLVQDWLPFSAPHPKSLVFGYPVVIVIKSSKVPYIGRGRSSAEKRSWVGYLLSMGDEEWDSESEC